MAWFWSITILVLLAFLLQQWIWKSRNKKSQLPPGPRGFPILGYFPMLGELLHHDLAQLAQKYGPIMHLRLGLVPTIVVSSPQAAELFLKEYDVVFASRPPQESAKHMSYDVKSMTFAPYNSYWRNVRRMCTQELLGNSKIDSFTSMRREELSQMIKFIQEASRNCVAVDLSAQVLSLNAAISCRMVFGKKYTDEDLDERGFKAMIHELFRLIALPNLNDYIPCLTPLDLQGLTRRMKALGKVFDDFFERIINERLHSKDQSNTKDFVDILLSFMGSEGKEYSIERPNVKAIILDMLAASMDTSATAIEWTLSELIRHPQVMKKLQKELEDVVGLERMVEEVDLHGLKYLDMVVKETLRLHPVAPLLLPREATKDCVVNGFYIPRKSRVLINAWAIGRDPSVWTNAEQFIPERFAGTNIDVRGRYFQLIPFGSGRRICPGMQLGLTIVRLVVAQLVHCFDWKLPDNMLPTELDMTEKFALATPRAKPLLAIPTFRLRI